MIAALGQAAHVSFLPGHLLPCWSAQTGVPTHLLSASALCSKGFSKFHLQGLSTSTPLGSILLPSCFCNLASLSVPFLLSSPWCACLFTFCSLEMPSAPAWPSLYNALFHCFLYIFIHLAPLLQKNEKLRLFSLKLQPFPTSFLFLWWHISLWFF